MKVGNGNQTYQSGIDIMKETVIIDSNLKKIIKKIVLYKLYIYICKQKHYEVLKNKQIQTSILRTLHKHFITCFVPAPDILNMQLSFL